MNSQVGSSPKPEMIRISVVARYEKYLYPLSLDQCERMCRDKVFKTATKLGAGRRAHWWVMNTEILKWKASRNASQLQDDYG